MEEVKSPYEFAILVVDDNEDILCVLAKFLEQNNIKYYTANNAEKALHLTAQHPDIKVLLTDLYMPGSCIDGKTLALIMIDREPRTVAFAMTGYVDKFSLDDCLRVGFRDYFVKPIDFQRLLKAIRCTCNQIKRWEGIR